MPCYTQWDAYLEKGSTEYLTKKSELEAKLKAAKHVVDYYLGANGTPIEQYTNQDQTKILLEEDVIKYIAHHLSCDGMHFVELYDLASLIDTNNHNESIYAHILKTCANEIRANKYTYDPGV